MGVVRLTATLASPIVLTDDLHLDGLLASAHPSCRASPIGRETGEADLIDPPLPICQLTAHGATVRLCTAAILPDEARTGSERAIRRRDGDDISMIALPIHLGLGPNKNRLHKLPTVVTPCVSWLAVGERRGLIRLARRIAFLGGWRSAGFGAVSAWTAEYVSQDEACATLLQGGVAQRHLPASWVEWAADLTVGPFRAPYWHPARQTESIVRAGSRCALHPDIEEQVYALAQPAACRDHRDRHVARADARRARRNALVSAETHGEQASD